MGFWSKFQKNGDHDFLLAIASHIADVVRCWATYTIAHNAALPIEEALRIMQVFAADKHFGVREISWMAIRNKIAGNLETSLLILSQWARHENENIRRFASESTRPRGVWYEHIGTLIEHPELALSIPNQLKADPSRYVQHSVGNWLNDAGKSKPGFVKELRQRWEKESPGKATAYIIKKALRIINK
jgi:3-methyladenine DNA glycosylase AlkC